MAWALLFARNGVRPAVVPARRGQDPPVYFSAQTLWPSEETIFVLESPLSGGHPLVQELIAHPALQSLEVLVPNWRRGYGSWDETQALVTAQGYEWG